MIKYATLKSNNYVIINTKIENELYYANKNNFENGVDIEKGVG